MNGFARIGWAALSAFLRSIAWLPTNVGWALSWCADWCELRAAQ